MEAAIPQDHIGQLIRQLKKLHNICVDNHPDIARITAVIVNDLEQLGDESNKISESLYKQRILELEEEILYLKELNMSQRMMMDDIVKHLLDLKSSPHPG